MTPAASQRYTLCLHIRPPTHLFDEDVKLAVVSGRQSESPKSAGGPLSVKRKHQSGLRHLDEGPTPCPKGKGLSRCAVDGAPCCVAVDGAPAVLPLTASLWIYFAVSGQENKYK